MEREGNESHAVRVPLGPSSQGILDTFIGIDGSGAGSDLVQIDYLRQQPYVKKGAINVIGWSYGASGSLQAPGSAWHRDPVQVDAVIAYYPVCDYVQQKWDLKVPVLVLAGAFDNVAPPRNCEGLFRNLPVTVRIYENAHHAFDVSELPAEMQYAFGTVGHNEAAAKSAWTEVANFLRK